MSEGDGLSRRHLIVGSIAALTALSKPLPTSRPNPWLSLRGGVRGLRAGQLERILASYNSVFAE
jgi:hypothetical protein